MSIQGGIAIGTPTEMKRKERIEEIQDTIGYTDPAVTRSQSAHEQFEGIRANPQMQQGEVDHLPGAVYAKTHPKNPVKKRESGEVFNEDGPEEQAKHFLETHQIQNQDAHSGTPAGKTSGQAVKIHASQFTSSLPPQAQQQYLQVLQGRHISIHSPKASTPKPTPDTHFFPDVSSPSNNSDLMSPMSSPSSLGASPSSIGHTMIQSPSSVGSRPASPSKQKTLISPQSLNPSPIEHTLTIHPTKVGGPLPHGDLVSFSNSPSLKSSSQTTSSHTGTVWKVFDSLAHFFSRMRISSKSHPPSLPGVSKPATHPTPEAVKKEDPESDEKTREQILKKNLEEAGLV